MDLFRIRQQDTLFLQEAINTILSARRTLKWSYVYGYYLDKSNIKEKNLFEYLQEDLVRHQSSLFQRNHRCLQEKHTEKLTQLYEKDLSKLNKDYHEFIKWKESVANYTRVTQGVRFCHFAVLSILYFDLKPTTQFAFQFLKKFIDGVMGGLTSQYSQTPTLLRISCDQ